MTNRNLKRAVSELDDLVTREKTGELDQPNNETESVERDNFFTPAFPVAEKLSNPDGPPIDGMEYLLLVRKDAESLPSYMTVKNHNNQTSIINENTFVNESYNPSSSSFQEIEDNNLRPTPEWQANFLATFQAHKEDFFQLRQSSPPPGLHPRVIRGNEKTYLFTASSSNGTFIQQEVMVVPTPSRLAFLSHYETMLLLNYFTTIFYPPLLIDKIQSQWLFGLLTRLDSLLIASDISSLRELCRNCFLIRNQPTATEEHILYCNSVLTIVSLHFGQLDMAP